MKKFFKFSIVVFTLSFSLLVFTSPSQGQPWYPPYSQGPYSQMPYSQGPNYSPYSSPPINININMGGFPGGPSMGYNPPYFQSYQPYPSVGSRYPTAELLISYSTADGDYIYVLYDNRLSAGSGVSGENGLVIFEKSGSDDYDYVSHISLFKGSGNFFPIPSGIVVQDDLAVIGASHGRIYFVDISDKDDPERIDTLYLNESLDLYDYINFANAGTIAVKDDVLFVATSEGVMGEDAETTIYAYDISDPDGIDEDDDLLDSYTIDDLDIHRMVIDSGYLYLAGNEYDDEPSIRVFDISDPENLSLEETFTDLDGDEYSRVNLAVKGDYLLATISIDQDASDYEDHGFKFKIINISDPENLSLVYSSSKMDGIPLSEQKNIPFSGDHVFLLSAIGDHGNWMGGGAWWTQQDEVLFESKVYVFDVSDPANAEKVETSSKYDGAGRGLYILDSDRLCLHTDTDLITFDISDPTDLSAEGSTNIYNIMDSKLDDSWYSPPVYTGSPYNLAYPYRQASYGGYNPYNNFNTYNNYSYPGYSNYGYGRPYGGYSNLGYPLPDYGGSYFNNYGFNTGYNSYSPGFGYGPSSYGGNPNYGYGGPTYGSYGGYGSPYGGYGGSGYSGYGGPTYGGYGPWGAW